VNIYDLDVFIKICEVGFEEACRLLKVNKDETLNIIKRLNNFVGIELFEKDEIPSSESLTVAGKTFLSSAIKITNEASSGLFNIGRKLIFPNRLVIRSSFGYAKTLLLPVIYKALEAGTIDKLKFDIMTQTPQTKGNAINTHVLFHNMKKVDSLFFDKRWSIRLPQGLYASEHYLSDAGMPRNIEDLENHSIIAQGYNFDYEVHNIDNWHLTGNYGLKKLDPSIVISSRTVLITAIETALGIGPVVDCHEKLGYMKLSRVLPEIKGPDVILAFCVNKMLPKYLIRSVDKFEIALTTMLSDIGLEIFSEI
jgi:hypothetical protein